MVRHPKLFHDIHPKKHGNQISRGILHFLCAFIQIEGFGKGFGESFFLKKVSTRKIDFSAEKPSLVDKFLPF